MTMNSFRLHRPATLDEALATLPAGRGVVEHTRPRVLAGGQDLLTEMKDRLIEPSALVDLNALRGKVEGFDEVRPWVRDGREAGLVIGALVTLDELERDERLSGAYALLREAAAAVGSVQIRSVGTVGGNLCQRPRCWYYRSPHAPCIKKGGTECYSFTGRSKYNAILGGGPSYIVHPSDLAPALVALDAEAVIRGARGERTVMMERFFTLPTEGSILRENVLAPQEILTHVRVPEPPRGARGTYLKFRERESFDFALSSVAAVLAIADAKVAHARLVLGGVAPIPWRCEASERRLTGGAADEASWTAAAQAAVAGAVPLAENGYKIPLTRNLVKRALRRLAAGGSR